MAKTDVEIMLATAAKVDHSRDEIDGVLKGLRADIDQAASGIWDGRASATFTSVMTSWDQSAGKLTHALQGISESIKNSGVGYDQSEQDNVANLKSVGGTLNL